MCNLGLEHSRCRHPSNSAKSSNWTVYEAEVFLCGEKSCPIVNGTQYQCLNPLSFGVEPSLDEQRNLEQGYGSLDYSDIWHALFSTTKQIFLTGSSRLIVLFKQSISWVFVEPYFYSFLLIMYSSPYLVPASVSTFSMPSSYSPGRRRQGQNHSTAQIQDRFLTS